MADRRYVREFLSMVPFVVYAVSCAGVIDSHQSGSITEAEKIYHFLNVPANSSKKRYNPPLSPSRTTVTSTLPEITHVENCVSEIRPLYHFTCFLM